MDYVVIFHPFNNSNSSLPSSPFKALSIITSWIARNFQFQALSSSFQNLLLCDTMEASCPPKAYMKPWLTMGSQILGQFFLTFQKRSAVAWGATLHMPIFNISSRNFSRSSVMFLAIYILLLWFLHRNLPKIPLLIRFNTKVLSCLATHW